MADATITVHFQQRAGAFDRIASLLRRRGFPITGITVERTHRQDIGRMTVGVGAREAIEQVRLHLAKLADVIDVRANSAESSVQREYALVRVGCDAAHQPEVQSALAPYTARVVAATPAGVVIEASGTRHSMDDLFADLAVFGIEESARTNVIALSHTAEGAGRPSA
jgi:acetolactate synthase small subunit